MTKMEIHIRAFGKGGLLLFQQFNAYRYIKYAIIRIPPLAKREQPREIGLKVM